MDTNPSNPLQNGAPPQDGAERFAASDCSALCSECKKHPRAHYDLCFECANELGDGDEDETHECPRCHGTGGDPMDDFCTPCDHCDGEGYEYWK